MTLRRRILDYTLAGLLLVLPALLLRASLVDPDDRNGLDQAVLRVSSPLQSAVTWIIEGVGGVWNRYVWLVDVEEENDELRADNRRLREELATATRRAQDTAVLEELIGLKRRTPADMLGARVIAADANAYFRVVRITIDRGEADVATGMPVIAGGGLVGRVGAVFGGHADVLLATDPASRIDVYVQRTGSQGLLRGLGKPDSYACEIEMLQRDKGPVEVGDLVVTSGLGEFPPGIAVGHITRVTTKDYGMFQEVEVEPAVDFSSLRNVIVLLAPPPEPDPTAGERRSSERAFGVFPY